MWRLLWLACLVLSFSNSVYSGDEEDLFKENSACFQARNLALDACLRTRKAAAANSEFSAKDGENHLRTQLLNLKEISDQYEVTKNKNDTSIKVFDVAKDLTLGSISVVGGATPAGLGVKVVAYGANKGLELVENQMKDQLNQSLRKNLATNVEKYRESVSKEEWADFASPGKTPEQVRAAIEARTGPLLGDALNDVKPDDQIVVQKIVDRELAAIMAQGFESVANVDKLQDAEIADNRKNIVALSQVFYKYAEENQLTLEQIVETQGELKDDLSQLNDSIGKTEQGVAFITNFMFGKMPASEQLAALHGGLFPDLPDDQRKVIEQKLSVVAKQQELENTLNKYINGADQLIGVAEHLGLSRQLTTQLRTVSSVASAGVKAFTAIASGDILSGVSAITSLFGLGGPDVAEQRHQEIMNSLNQIYQGITVLDQKLDQIQKTQQTIIDNQKITLKAIVDVGNDVEKAYQALDAHLTKIEGAIYVNRDLIDQYVRNDYSSCFDLIEPRPERIKIIDTASGTFPEYNRLRTLLRDESIQMNHCSDRLLQIRAEDDSFLPIFFLKSEDVVGSPALTFIDKVYQPACLLYLRTGDTSVDGMSRKISALFLPATTCEVVVAKIKANVDAYQSRLHFNKGNLHLLMGDMLSPQRVLRHGKLLLDAHVLYLVTSHSDNALLPRDQLLKGWDLRRTAYEPLVEMLSLTDIAIAQQTLLSGDVLLPVLYNTIVAGLKANDGTVERDNYNKAVGLLKNSAILAENFAVYIVHREVMTKSNRLAYYLALQSTVDEELHLVLSSSWEVRYAITDQIEGDIVKSPQGWSFVFDMLRISLPDTERMVEGNLRVQPEIGALVMLRQRLLEEIATYDVADKLDTEQNKTWNQFLLDRRPLAASP